jgi:Domain of unknown function (DUF4276)
MGDSTPRLATAMNVLLVSEGIHEEAGALESLIMRVEPRIKTCAWQPSSRKDIATRKGKGQGFFKRAIRWILQARKEGYDALVLVIDEDGRPERARELSEAQGENSQTGLFPRALGIAIRSFDAWILADEKALSTVLKCIVDRQPSPESNREPKQACEMLLAHGAVEMRPRDFYAAVAERIDLQCLCDRCPKGFGAFAVRLRSL